MKSLWPRVHPGHRPDSFCSGFGDAPGLTLHAILDEHAQLLEALAVRPRALITSGWQQNLEIAGLIAAAEAAS